MTHQLGPLGDKELRAYRTLPDRIISPPILILPYSLHTDASANMVGVAAFQSDERGQRRPIGFWSRSPLLPAEKNYSASERESLVVVWAVTSLRPYLHGSRFIVRTDHASVRRLLEIAEPSGRLTRWGTFFFGIRF